jgi:hypothetical protein
MTGVRELWYITYENYWVERCGALVHKVPTGLCDDGEDEDDDDEKDGDEVSFSSKTIYII